MEMIERNQSLSEENSTHHPTEQILLYVSLLLPISHDHRSRNVFQWITLLCWGTVSSLGSSYFLPRPTFSPLFWYFGLLPESAQTRGVRESAVDWSSLLNNIEQTCNSGSSRDRIHSSDFENILAAPVIRSTMTSVMSSIFHALELSHKELEHSSTPISANPMLKVVTEKLLAEVVHAASIATEMRVRGERSPDRCVFLYLFLFSLFIIIYYDYDYFFAICFLNKLFSPSCHFMVITVWIIHPTLYPIWFILMLRLTSPCMSSVFSYSFLLQSRNPKFLVYDSMFVGVFFSDLLERQVEELRSVLETEKNQSDKVRHVLVRISPSPPWSCSLRIYNTVPVLSNFSEHVSIVRALSILFCQNQSESERERLERDLMQLRQNAEKEHGGTASLRRSLELLEESHR